MQTRARKTAGKQCGAMEDCDERWEHVFDWSPFGVWHCLLCRMPQALCVLTGFAAAPRSKLYL
jgi:hypothetical protein